MKFETIKTIVIIVIALVILGAAYVGAKEIINHFTLKSKLIEAQMVRLSKSVISQQVQVNTKLLEDRIDGLDTVIKQTVKERDQQITDMGKSVAKIKSRVELEKRESDKTYTGKREIMHYEFKKIYAEDTEGKKYPVAWVMFFPNQVPGKKWKTGTYSIEIHERITLAENDKRVDSIVEVWLENNKNSKTKGIKYPINLESVDWVRREKKDRKWMWNPRLSLGMSIGEDAYPNLGLSMFSYGRTKRDMDWRFFDIGIGGNSDDWFVQFTPVEYNIGNFIPLVENIFAGPYVNINEDVEYGFGGQLAVPF